MNLSPEELLSCLEFDTHDLTLLKMLDNALSLAEGGSRLSFLIGAVRESAKSRLEVPHNML